MKRNTPAKAGVFFFALHSFSEGGFFCDQDRYYCRKVPTMVGTLNATSAIAMAITA
jgi:hypothetical protein